MRSRIAYARHLARKGWLDGEAESAFLADSIAGDDGMDALRMSFTTYRIATGRDAGRKVVTLQTLPADAGSLECEAGKVGGFSLHAGVAAEVHESEKLERLCRCIARPAISEKRLSIAPQGRVWYELKTPWRNGTTHGACQLPLAWSAGVQAVRQRFRAGLQPEVGVARSARATAPNLAALRPTTRTQRTGRLAGLATACADLRPRRRRRSRVLR